MPSLNLLLPLPLSLLILLHLALPLHPQHFQSILMLLLLILLVKVALVVKHVLVLTFLHKILYLAAFQFVLVHKHPLALLLSIHLPVQSQVVGKIVFFKLVEHAVNSRPIIFLKDIVLLPFLPQTVGLLPKAPI
jgi:hypothetical protein